LLLNTTHSARTASASTTSACAPSSMATRMTTGALTRVGCCEQLPVLLAQFYEFESQVFLRAIIVIWFCIMRRTFLLFSKC
jgi:hypothetical protein